MLTVLVHIDICVCEYALPMSNKQKKKMYELMSFINFVIYFHY